MIKTTKAEQSKRRRREREGKETYLDMRRNEPLLKSPGFNAIFYTPCPGVTRGRHSLQYDRLWTEIDEFWNRPFPHGLTQLKLYLGIYHNFLSSKDLLLKKNKPKYTF